MTLPDEYRFRVETPVAWGDMDAFGHVNNVIYLRYFETGRVAYFEQFDYLKGDLCPGCGPIIASTLCNFRSPVVYPDTLTIGLKVQKPRTTSFQMDFAMASAKQGKIVADGHAVVVHYNYRENRKEPLPEILLKAMEQQEAWSL